MESEATGLKSRLLSLFSKEFTGRSRANLAEMD
jgi:hypothetical protein